jgi:serine/threonine-protein kinase
MGEVFRAVDERTGQEVAVKSTDLGRWGPAQRASLLDGFRREGQTLLRLKHPHLPKFFDFFEEDEQAYLVMELIPGQNLAQRVEESGPLPEPVLLSILERLASLLVYLHGQSPPVIFRDLKPANIMVNSEGSLKLIDFGLAKSLPGGSQEPTQTSARGLVSPGFAAPEQYSGGTDERSDLYALGATAYYLATAATPPDSVDRASGSALLSPDRLNPDLSAATALWITRLMQLKRDKRPASAIEVLQQLRQRAGGQDTVAVSRPPVRRRGGKLTLALLAVVPLGWWWTLTPQQYALHVETSPPGARVFLENQSVANTPCNLTVQSSSKLRLELPGYYPVEEEPARFTREPLSLFVRMRPGTPQPGQVQADQPGFYPPGRGSPPWPLIPWKTALLDGHGYGLFSEFKQWSVVTSTNKVVEWRKGDGQFGSLYRARLQSVPAAGVSDMLEAEVARQDGHWILVRSLVEEHTGSAYFEHQNGAVAGRLAWVVRTSANKALQLEVEMAPCLSPYDFLRVVDLLRCCLRMRDSDPV